MESHGGIEVIIGDNGTINVVQDGVLTGDMSAELTNDNDAAPCNKSEKPPLMHATQDHSLTYQDTMLVHADLPQAVLCHEAAEPRSTEAMMEHQTSTSPLPTMAIAPAPSSDGGSAVTKPDEGDDINQAWFTTKEDKDVLQGKGVKWRQGMWSKDEVGLLKKNIFDYCKAYRIADPRDVIFKQSKDERKSFYRTIAKGIHRPLFAIYRRVLRTYESGNYVGKYSSDEVQILKELRRKHGNDWSSIGLALGRSASSVKDRCRLLKDTCTSGKWSEDEEQRLSSAVRELTCTKRGDSVTTGILWTEVAKVVGTRSEKQCRSKWLNFLNWKECGGKEWNKNDEIDLIKKIYDLGLDNENDIDWAALADGWVSVRSPQWLRSKWWTIKKHVPSSMKMSFRDTTAYLYSNYAKHLRQRLNHQDPRFLQMSPPSEQADYPSYSASVTTVAGQAISGEIFMSRDDGKITPGFEVVHLRALPNPDPSQPTSYIIEPIQCSISGPPPSAYLLSQQHTSPCTTKLVKITDDCTVTQHEIGNSNADTNNTQVENIEQPTTDHQASNVITSMSDIGNIPKESDAVTRTSEKFNCDSTRTTTSHSEQTRVQNDVNVGQPFQDSASLEEHHQTLECLNEGEMSVQRHQERGNCEDCENSVQISPHHHMVDKTSIDNSTVDNQINQCTSDCHQPMDINFPTSDNSLILMPSLVSHTQTTSSPSSQIATSDVVTPQSTLPENILQSQGDEPAFLSDTVINASSPLSMVAESLAEVTVPSTDNGLTSSGDLIMDGDFH